MAALPAQDRAAPAAGSAPSSTRNRTRALVTADGTRGTLRRSAKGLRIDIEDGPLADWLEAEAETVLTDLHARWMRATEKLQ